MFCTETRYDQKRTNGSARLVGVLLSKDVVGSLLVELVHATLVLVTLFTEILGSTAVAGVVGVGSSVKAWKTCSASLAQGSKGLLEGGRGEGVTNRSS